MGSTVRSLDVRLNAKVAGYIRDVRSAGRETKQAFDEVHASSSRARDSIKQTERAAQELTTTTNRLGATSRSAGSSQRQLSTDIDRVSVAAVRGSASIDQYSGRLRILTDLLAILGPGLAPIGGAGLAGIGGLAALFGGATVGALALVGAVQGVGDALKVVEEARLDPTAANLAKAEEAMSRLAPEAREFVARFSEIRPVLIALRDAGAEQFFPGLTASLDDLERVAPMLQRIMSGAGRAGGDAIAGAAESLTTDRWEPFFDFLADEVPGAITSATTLLGSLSHAGAELWMAFDPSNDRFVDWLLDVGDGLDRWASSTEGQEDIRSFLGYVEKTAPKVGDFVVAVADAFTQITQAAAPLGGPVLDSLTAILEVLAGIADSDIGTPLFTGLAALALYTRASKLLGTTAGISMRQVVTGQRDLAASAVAGYGRASGAVRRFGGDLVNVARYGRLATESSKRLSTQVGALVRTGGIIGGVAVAATGAADGMGLTNTASLALMGTIAGPWGAAIGGGIGLVMDFASSMDDATSSTESFRAAMDSADASTLRDDLAAVDRELANIRDIFSADDTKGDFFGDLLGASKGGFQDILGKFGVGDGFEFEDTLEERRSVLEGQIATVEHATLTEAGFSDALITTGYRAGLSAEQLLGLADSTRKSSEAAWSAFDAQTRLGEALDDVAAAAGEGKRGLDASTEGGRENREALSQLASSWAETRDAMIANGDSTKAIERRYREVRRALMAAAEKMGVARSDAKKLAAQLAKPMTIVVRTEIGDAVTSARAAMERLRAEIAGRPIVQRVVVQTSKGPVKAKVGAPGGVGALLGGENPADGGTIPWGGGRPRRSAEGSTVPKDGGPYGDRYPYLLAPGEEVISNRAGQADRWRPLLKAINAGRLADGGTAGSRGDVAWQPAGAGRVAAYRAADVDTTSRSLKDITGGLKGMRRELHASEKALEKERRERDAARAKRDDLASGIRGGLDHGIWKPGDNAWSEDAGDPVGHIVRNRAEIAEFDRLTGRLKKAGVKDAALDAILADGDIDTVRAYAGLDTATLRAYQRQYNAQQRDLKNTSAGIADDVWGPELRQQTREAREANRWLKKVDHRLDQLTKTHKSEQAKNRAAAKRGAGKASNAKSRGYL